LLLLSPLLYAVLATKPVQGDVDLDGGITVVDGHAALAYSVGKAPPAGWFASPNGDGNCDGAVTALDALLILSHVVEKDLSAYCVGDPVRIVSVTLTPAALALALGTSRTLTGQARDSLGRVFGGVSFAWSSSDPGVVSVDANGVATAGTLGTAVVTATADSAGGGIVSVVSDSAASVFDLSRDDAVGGFVKGIGAVGDSINAKLEEVGRGIAEGDVAASQAALVQARASLNGAAVGATGDAVVLVAVMDLVLAYMERAMGAS